MTSIKEKVLKKLRNYGYTTIEKERDAEFIIDRTLKDVLKLIDEFEERFGFLGILSVFKELKARITG